MPVPLGSLSSKVSIFQWSIKIPVFFKKSVISGQFSLIVNSKDMEIPVVRFKRGQKTQKLKKIELTEKFRKGKKRPLRVLACFVSQNGLFFVFNIIGAHKVLF